MATIVNSPDSGRVVERERVVDSSSGSAGWIVAIIILIAVIALGAYYLTRSQTGAPVETGNDGTTDINVTVPNPVNNILPSVGTTSTDTEDATITPQ